MGSSPPGPGPARQRLDRPVRRRSRGAVVRRPPARPRRIARGTIEDRSRGLDRRRDQALGGDDLEPVRRGRGPSAGAPRRGARRARSGRYELPAERSGVIVAFAFWAAYQFGNALPLSVSSWSPSGSRVCSLADEEQVVAAVRLERVADLADRGGEDRLPRARWSSWSGRPSRGPRPWSSSVPSELALASAAKSAPGALAWTWSPSIRASGGRGGLRTGSRASRTGSGPAAGGRPS